MTKNSEKRELPPGVAETLKQWLLSPDHIGHPYPTSQEQAELMKICNISRSQIKNWFTNARRRIWKPILKRKFGAEVYSSGPGGQVRLDLSKATTMPADVSAGVHCVPVPKSEDIRENQAAIMSNLALVLEVEAAEEENAVEATSMTTENAGPHPLSRQPQPQIQEQPELSERAQSFRRTQHKRARRADKRQRPDDVNGQDHLSGEHVEHVATGMGSQQRKTRKRSESPSSSHSCHNHGQPAHPLPHLYAPSNQHLLPPTPLHSLPYVPPLYFPLVESGVNTMPPMSQSHSHHHHQHRQQHQHEPHPQHPPAKITDSKLTSNDGRQMMRTLADLSAPPSPSSGSCTLAPNRLSSKQLNLSFDTLSAFFDGELPGDNCMEESGPFVKPLDDSPELVAEEAPQGMPTSPIDPLPGSQLPSNPMESSRPTSLSIPPKQYSWSMIHQHGSVADFGLQQPLSKRPRIGLDVMSNHEPESELPPRSVTPCTSSDRTPLLLSKSTVSMLGLLLQDEHEDTSNDHLDPNDFEASVLSSAVVEDDFHLSLESSEAASMAEERSGGVDKATENWALRAETGSRPILPMSPSLRNLRAEMQLLADAQFQEDVAHTRARTRPRARVLAVHSDDAAY